MFFEWRQQRGNGSNAQFWDLVHKEAGYKIITVFLSGEATEKENIKIRKKIKKAYQAYYVLVWYKTLRFF